MATPRYTSIASTPDQEIDLAHLQASSSKFRLQAVPWPIEREASSFVDGGNTSQHRLRPSQPLGVPMKKPWLVNWLDLLAVLISLASSGFAIASVVNNRFAWRLGVTYQLIIVGFLLSIMNICLNYILPSVFLPLEARFGKSTLQNFEALLRNKPFASMMEWYWRVVLVLLALLPLGLSAGYKLFIGGIAVTEVKPGDELYGDVFGMFSPPGMQPLGANTGVGLIFNATTPFVEASTTLESALLDNQTYGDPAFDPPLPVFPKAYGFNTLLLTEASTAMLDAPFPAWVNRVRDALEAGEAWNISATVTATISTYNSSVDEHRNEYYDLSTNSTFWNYYGGQGGPKWSKLYNGWNIGLVTNYAMTTNRDESWAFVGLVPDPPNDNLTTFAPVAKMYNTIRAPCNGTWTITRGGIQLVDGTCDLPRAQRFEQDQLVLRNNQLAFPDWYLPILVEFLGPFATVRNESRWLMPSVTTMVAGMVWSRVTALNGPGSPYVQDDAEGYRYYDYGSEEWRRTNDTGLSYDSPGTRITSSRSTLQRSGGLFFLFVLQPILTVAVLVLGCFLRDVPVGKGFGMVAVLSGLERKGENDLLEGAAFSGRLRERVGLHVSVLAEGDGRGRVSYEIGPVGVRSKARLERGRLYR